MTQRAVVKRRLGADRVEILVKRVSACSHNCADCAGCGSMVKTPDMTAVAEDTMGAQAGQQVTVESASKPLLWYAFLLYILPFVGMFAAAAALQGTSEGLAALVAVGTFVGVLAGVSLPLDRYLHRHKAVTFRVVAVER